jgi:hypothetical protein
MNKIWICIAVLLFLYARVDAQIWKPVQSQYQALYKVYETKIPIEADIIAFQVEKEYDAVKPGFIYLAPPWYSRGSKVYFTKDKYEADFIVYWTKDKNKVIWKIK